MMPLTNMSGPFDAERVGRGHFRSSAAQRPGKRTTREQRGYGARPAGAGRGRMAPAMGGPRAQAAGGLRGPRAQPAGGCPRRRWSGGGGGQGAWGVFPPVRAGPGLPRRPTPPQPPRRTLAKGSRPSAVRFPRMGVAGGGIAGGARATRRLGPARTGGETHRDSPPCPDAEAPPFLQGRSPVEGAASGAMRPHPPAGGHLEKKSGPVLRAHLWRHGSGPLSGAGPPAETREGLPRPTTPGDGPAPAGGVRGGRERAVFARLGRDGWTGSTRRVLTSCAVDRAGAGRR